MECMAKLGNERFLIVYENEYHCYRNTYAKHFTPLMFFASVPGYLKHKNLLDELSKYISENKAELDKQNSLGLTALMLACLHVRDINSTVIIEQLIDAGANLEIKDNSGWTALTYSVGFSKVFSSASVVELLLNKGANINTQSDVGYTPVMIAVIYSNNWHDLSTHKTVKILIDNNADLSLQSTTSKQSGFKIICEGMNLEFVKYCFDKHTYYKEEDLIKCISYCIKASKKITAKLLASYLAKLYFEKGGQFLIFCESDRLVCL